MFIPHIYIYIDIPPSSLWHSLHFCWATGPQRPWDHLRGTWGLFGPLKFPVISNLEKKTRFMTPFHGFFGVIWVWSFFFLKIFDASQFSLLVALVFMGFCWILSTSNHTHFPLFTLLEGTQTECRSWIFQKPPPPACHDECDDSEPATRDGFSHCCRWWIKRKEKNLQITNHQCLFCESQTIWKNWTPHSCWQQSPFKSIQVKIMSCGWGDSFLGRA